MPDAKKKKVNSRAKGAAFERAVAKELFRQTGVNFRRDLDQYRERDRGDLLPDDDAWPFTIECKVSGRAKSFQTEWQTQVFRACDNTGLYPCVVWKLDFQDPIARVWLPAIAEAVGGQAVCGQHADITLQGLAWVAGEIMARRAKE